MVLGSWLLAALLAGEPAVAGTLQFEGHAVSVEGVADARQVESVRGTRYAIHGTSAQIVGKAQQCLSRKDSQAGIVSVDQAHGRLEAVSRVDYGDVPSQRLVKGRLTVEADTGAFSVVLSNLGIRQAGSADPMDEVFSPLQLRTGSDWELALAAMIEVEQSLVGCMFH